MAIRDTNASHIKNGNIGLFMLLFPPSVVHRLPRGQPNPLAPQPICDARCHRWTSAAGYRNVPDPP
jgi:hypothetical protein